MIPLEPFLSSHTNASLPSPYKLDPYQLLVYFFQSAENENNYSSSNHNWLTILLLLRPLNYSIIYSQNFLAYQKPVHLQPLEFMQIS